MPPSLPKFIFPCIALTAILSLVSIGGRFKVEERNRAVAICAEYETVESLAASQGISVDRAFESLRQQGLRGVVLTEETAGDLISEGRLAVRYEGRDIVDGRLVPTVSGSPEDMARLLRGNRIRYGGFSVPKEISETQERFPNLTPGMLRALPLGIDPDAAKHVKAANLLVIARMGNPVGISSQGVIDTITWAAETGASIFLPVGDQVLGRRNAKGSLVRALTDHHMLYASPEFAKIGGDEQMLEAAPELVVRLHSAQAAELDKLPFAEAVDRYARAARERNMRLLLLRPVDYADPQPLFRFGDFTQAIAKTITRQGSVIGDPHPFTEPSVPRAIFPLIALSLAPIGWWLGSVIDTMTGRRFFANSALSIAIVLAILAWSPHYRQYAALFGAILLPITAFVMLDAYSTKRAILAYTLTTAVSLTGGLVVAGLLNSLPYYVRALEFPGVKISVFLPIIAAGVYYFIRLTDAKSAMKSPVTWTTSLITLVLLAAVAIMAVRTGNDNPAAVSETELRIRNVLDALLFVRPRTKSFLIGFPLLFVGVSMLLRFKSLDGRIPDDKLRRLGGWTALLLACGAIGMTDIVNTLCHIHTQIALSFARIGVAFVVGTIIGWILWIAARRWMPRAEAAG